MMSKVIADFHALANQGIRHLTPYQPGKPIEELERELGIRSAIKLASNENPLGPSKKAIEAAQTAFSRAHIYPDGSYYELKNALAAHLNINTQQITVGNGSENILELIIKTFLHTDTNAVISEFAFLTIPLLIKSYAAPLKVVPAKEWRHDIPAMLNAIDDKTRLLFIVNPNNPTGTYINAADFDLLIRHVPPHVLVVVDEAYYEYITQKNYPDTLAYLPTHPQLIITRTFSKAYGLAGLRLGYAISSPEVCDLLNRSRLPFNVNSIAAIAAIAALQDHAHLEQTIVFNQLGKQQVEEGLQELGIDYIESVCNFITITVPHAERIYQSLLLEGVIVRPLQAYQMPQHIRVTIGTPEENSRFLAAIKKVRHQMERQ